MRLFRKKNTYYLFVFISAVCVLMLINCSKGKTYETNSINDFGRYIGNYNNEVPADFINSFFPYEISDNFSFVEYHYKAKKLDTYSYEAYLDFCIEDTESFFEYVENYVSILGDPTVFPYDNAFEEYNISNVYSIASNKEITGEESHRILTAQVGKILVSYANQRIIYVAIGNYDGGGTDTDELSHFFEKFNIDPIEYAKNSFESNYEEEQSKREP